MTSLTMIEADDDDEEEREDKDDDDDLDLDLDLDDDDGDDDDGLSRRFLLTVRCHLYDGVRRDRSVFLTDLSLLSSILPRPLELLPRRFRCLLPHPLVE